MYILHELLESAAAGSDEQRAAVDRVVEGDLASLLIDLKKT